MNMKRFMNKKVAAIGLAAGLALGAAGAAFAYFTGSGNGTGQGTVGTTATWNVAQTNVSGVMYPGHGSTDLTFTVTNNGQGNQAIESGNLSAAVLADGSGYITSHGASVTGCLQSWFTAPVIDAPALGYGHNLDVGASDTVDVHISLTNTPTVNQDACKGATPDVTLTVTQS